QPVCSGAVNLTFEPSPASVGTRVTAIINGLSNCQGKEVRLVNGTNCSKDLVGNTTIGSAGNGANINFTAPNISGTYNYTACVDMNGDGNWTNNENKTVSLNVVECLAVVPGITAYPDIQRNDAGEIVYYRINVTNRNSCTSKFNLTANCSNCTEDGWNFEIVPNTLYLKSGETKSVLLKVEISPNAKTNVWYDITINITDTMQNGKTNTSVVYFTPRICSRDTLPLSVSPSEIAVVSTSRSSEQVALTFTNPSSECTTIYNITATCPENWNCSLDPTPFWLLANEKGNQTLTITPEANASPGNYSINITANVKNLDNITTNTSSVLFKIVNCTDEDGDGFYTEGPPCGPRDCNDADPNINPNATVYCFSTEDANCDNITDKNDPRCIARNESITDAINPKYKVGDGKCDSWAGENSTNSPIDCAPSTPAPGKCGNKIKEAGEDCDGTDDAACPGLCTTTCKCPFLVGDGVCDSGAGETAAISPADCKPKASPILPLIIIAILGGVGGAMGLIFYKRKSELSTIMSAHGVESYAPDQNPTPAIESALAQGLTPAEISSQFTQAGWPEEQIKSSFKEVQDTQQKLSDLATQHGVDVPTAERRQAERYVKKCLDMGFTPTQIKTALLSADWPESIIDDILAKHTSSHVRAHAKKAGVLKPTADIESLKSYVKEELDEGHTPEQIREELLKAGWDEAKINEVLP
ncbi:MAG: NEW3 domain-containing protein, partial [Candidatus Nanoarchaeia archaeon]